MEKGNSKKIFSYLHRTGKTIIVAIFFFVISALMFYFFIRPVSIGSTKVYHLSLIIFAGIFFILGVGMIITETANRKSIHTMLNQYDQSLLICDFDGAKAFYKDHLRVGRTYIYSKEAEKIIPISDIRILSLRRNSADTLCILASDASGHEDKWYVFGEKQYDDVLNETQILANELMAVNNAIEFRQI